MNNFLSQQKNDQNNKATNKLIHQVNSPDQQKENKQPEEKKPKVSKIFDEIVSTREKQLLDEAKQLYNHLEQQEQTAQKVINTHKEKNEKQIKQLQEYLKKYTKKQQKLKQNYKVFNEAMKSQGLLENIQNLDFTDLFDVVDDRNIIPDYFKDFKYDEFNNMRRGLEVYAKKLYRARVTDEVVKQREILVAEIDEIIQKLNNVLNTKEKVLPILDEEILVTLESKIAQLQSIDSIIPHIVCEVLNKASDFGKQLFDNFINFRQNAQQICSQLQNFSSENDRSFKNEFLNINLAEPSKIRVYRYNVSLKNEDLASLQEGRILSENLVLFLIEYFSERNSSAIYKNSQILVFKSAFFTNLLPTGSPLLPESLNYDNVKHYTQDYRGNSGSIFDKFQKILISMQITSNNWILVEIKNQPEKEILIYDSDMRLFLPYHERICSIIRLYIQLELQNKTDLPTDQCASIAGLYVGRSVAVPQNSLPQDNCLFFCKNLAMCAQGKVVHSTSYNSQQINAFRLEVFTNLLRIGLNQDRNLQFEILF